MNGAGRDRAPASAAARVYASVRIVFAMIILATLAWQLHISITRFGGGPVRFFSFFTVLSNTLLAVVFLVASLRILTDRESTYGLERLRGAAVVYMVTTGAVYALLLASHGQGHGGGVTEWLVNLVVHRIAPVVALLDWVLAPPRVRLHVSAWLSWLLFPLAFLAYTLIRGSLVHWYPYPFLNPSPDGYGEVAIYSVGIALGMLALAFLLGWIGNRLGRAARGA